MQSPPPPLMLFAAGLGTRMGALTADRPKPMIPVAGRPLIDHALALADAAGIDRIVANLHYRPDPIRAHLAGRPGLGFSVEPDLLETGGGLRAALPLLGSDTVVTLNTDAVWTTADPLGDLLRHWDPVRMEALLLLVPRDRAIGHRGAGDFLMARDGRLTRGPGAVFAGAQILRTGRLEAVREPAFSLNPVWDDMARDGTLYGLVHSGGWCDVGRPDAIALAEQMLGNPNVRD